MKIKGITTNHALTTPLPKVATTRSGVQYLTESDAWSFRDGTAAVCMKFDRLPEITNEFKLSLKKNLEWYLSNRSPVTAGNHFETTKRILDYLAEQCSLPVNEIRKEHILNFLTSDTRAEHWLYQVRGFLLKWRKHNLPGIPEETAELLRTIYLRPHTVGASVSTLDPYDGPLTDLEFEAIQCALNNAYERNEVDESKVLITYLFLALGLRPVQLASLKCYDLIIPNATESDYVLMVPRCKQVDRLERSEFKARKLTHQLGSALHKYVKRLQKEYSATTIKPDQIPLFPQLRGSPNTCPGFLLHSTPTALSRRIEKVFDKIKVPSERSASPIHIFPLRLRRTFATRACEEGLPLHVVAELLDHADTRNVEIYAGLTSKVRANFSRRIAMEMAPLANAFAGKIVRNESEASRPGTGSRIIDLRIDHSEFGIGSCASCVKCEFTRPYACYAGCLAFEPWLDGPHEAALEYMLAQREYLNATTDIRIASINDRAILGCAQVIRRCREIMDNESDD